MSNEFDDFDDDDETMTPEEYLAEHGLLGDMLSITCAQEPDDYMTIRRIGDTEHQIDEEVPPVVSLVTFVEQANATEGHISGGIMLTAEGARVVAAHLLNAADEIDGFKAMFNITEGGTNS